MKRNSNTRKNIIILTVLVLSLILLIAIDKATKPIPLSYGEAIESIKNEDDKVFIKFTPEVSNIKIDSFAMNHELMAWKTNISKILKNNKPQKITININADKNVPIYFINQTGELDKKIYSPISHVPLSNSGQEHNSGRVTLPRLAMNYYLSIMVLIFIVLWILSIIFRKKDRIKKKTTTLMMIPVSYLIAHICILGSQGATHHIKRDMAFVIVSTILIFSIIMIIRNRNLSKI